MQDYCDWCYGPLTEASRGQSEALGLPREESWACDECLATGRFHEPPDGWDAPYEWPFAAV